MALMRLLALAALTLVLTFVWAALIALVFRFPIPLGGYASGLDAMRLSPIAVLFYGVFFGGFLVPLVLAFLVEALVRLSDLRLGPRARLWLAANAGAFASVMTLALLDFIIGPW